MATDEDSEAVIVGTPTGPITIQGAVHAKWRALRAETTPDGDDVQAHLGHPLAEHVAISLGHGSGTVQLFHRGMIVVRADGRAFVVYGAIYDHYGGIGGICSDLGQPTSDEEAAGRGGRVAHFDHGDIYWREDVGAWEVHGARRDRYAARGYPFTMSWAERAAAVIRRVRRAARRYRRPRAGPGPSA
jgi:uncharacterized protein with LGFP repeats